MKISGYYNLGEEDAQNGETFITEGKQPQTAEKD